MTFWRIPSRQRRNKSWRAAACAALIATALAGIRAAAQDAPIDVPQLARTWDHEHVSPPLPPLLNHDDLSQRLTELAAANPDLFALEKIGESLEGRSIADVRVGSGSTVVMLWSQMHGDEPTATAALLDIFEYLRRHRDDPAVRRILSSL